MVIKFYCKCGKKVSVPDNDRNLEGNCPKCGKLVSLKDADPTTVERDPFVVVDVDGTDAKNETNEFGIVKKEDESSTDEKEGTPENYDEIKKLISKYKEKIYLPLDFAQQQNTDRSEIDLSELPTNYNLFDIGEKSIDNFKQILSDAKTVFLSGPCGVFENPTFMKGTKEIFTYVAQSDVFSIVGGGHTVAAVEKLGLDSKISHISTGGGSLEKFMMGEKLPVVEALINSKKKSF